ncbi:transglycosylase domain-containing protein [Ilumatobacter sp.]|uniref:transglycosylase domain-containing protein n=1 Tax=Ilumatobacter sp. TaxID=1967498 RepID=UPI003B52188F
MQRLSWIPRLALVVAGGALLIVAIVVAVAPRLWQVANAHAEDPVVLPEFTPLAQRTYVYDRFGTEIALYELENSQPIAYDDIPVEVIQAFLVVEDKEFFTHDGVNVRSLFRATLSNFASDAPQQGASTITMQVVKNDFLAGLERDGRYKLLQIQYAKRLEKERSKPEIMERYLNTVFFGNNAYGIQAAAETYYGKTVDQLTFIEAVFLAGLVRSPSGFDPINSPERSRARWRQVLDRLVSEQILTEERADEIFETEPIPERVRTIESRTNERTYFTEALRDHLLNRSTILGATYEERYNQLFRGGLRIHTTLDPNMQIAGERAQELLPQNTRGFEAAMVSLDAETAAVRVMVGGRGFSSDDQVNMALAPRQTGSSIKYFILAAAIQAGAQAGDEIDGRIGCSFDNPGDLEEPVYTIDGGVTGFIGDLRDITARSVNCGFARLSQAVGLNRVVDTTYRMASSDYLNRSIPSTEREPIQPFISFATGANEMSPLDMAAGIQSLANEGVHHQPYYVEHIDDADGERIHTHFDPGTEVLDRDVALETVDILKGTLDYGTARFDDLEDDRPAFGKTGTQQDNTNAWFVGGTRQLATAVWVGNPDAYTPMVGIPEFDVPRVQGGTYPSEIWKSFTDAASAGMPVVDWDAPAPPERPNARIVLPGNECTVVVVGRTGGDVIANQTPTVSTPSPGASGASGDDGTSAGIETGNQTEETTATTAAPTESSAPATNAPVRTTPIVVITAKEDVGTTIPPDNLDPNAPLPTVPLSTRVSPC